MPEEIITDITTQKVEVKIDESVAKALFANPVTNGKTFNV